MKGIIEKEAEEEAKVVVKEQQQEEEEEAKKQQREDNAHYDTVSKLKLVYEGKRVKNFRVTSI